MEKNSTINTMYELYFKCSCSDGGRRITKTKADYIYNIESINCKMLKYYPFHKENTEQYHRKLLLIEKYYNKFGEHYIDNLTPCKRQAVLQNHPFLTINTDKK